MNRWVVPSDEGNEKRKRKNNDDVFVGWSAVSSVLFDFIVRGAKHPLEVRHHTTTVRGIAELGVMSCRPAWISYWAEGSN